MQTANFRHSSPRSSVWFVSHATPQDTRPNAWLLLPEHNADCTQHRNGFLPKDCHIVGYARTKMDRNEYLNRVKSYIKTPAKEVEDQLAEFLERCSYVSGQYDEDESFQNLEVRLKEVEKGRPTNNRIFYMALPPSVFTTVSQRLKKNCYPDNGIARLIVRSSALSLEPGY